MSSSEKANYARAPYSLETRYAEKYVRLSRDLEERTGASLPRLPNTNQQLMSYDTTPLRDMQKEKEEAAADLFKKAREAQAAAARMAELRQLAQDRANGMNSIQQNSAGLHPSRATASDQGAIETEAKRDTVKEKTRSADWAGSSPSGNASGISSAERIPRPNSLLASARSSEAAKRKEEKKILSPAEEALAKMEAAKMLLAKKQAEAAEALRPKMDDIRQFYQFRG